MGDSSDTNKKIEERDSVSKALDTTVIVYSPDMIYIVGIGKIVDYEDPCGIGMDTPKIELTSGKVVYGFECRWEPLVLTGNTFIHGE